MIRICRNGQEVFKTKQQMELLKMELQSILLDKDVFFKAREELNKHGGLLEVKGKEEEVLFYFVQEDDFIIQPTTSKKIYVESNYDGCDLVLEKSNLDLSLIEEFDTFVFCEVEEYTYALTEFIHKFYTNKRIIFLDKYAELFWDCDIELFESCRKLPFDKLGKYMYITSDGISYDDMLPDKISHTYNSVNVINSLCWARKKLTLGKKNNEKTILLIDCSFSIGCGMAYIIRSVSIFILMAIERGWTPVVNLTGQNLYLDNPDDNMWNYYFQPVSEISVEEAMQSRSVIRLTDNKMGFSAIWVNPYFREKWRAEDNYSVFFNQEVEKRFLEQIPRELQEDSLSILGIVMRGTELTVDKRYAGEKESVQSLMMEIKDIMQESGYEKIFLATEDEDYYLAFKQFFNDKVICIPQKRVSYNYEKNEYKCIGELLDPGSGHRKEWGNVYLLVTYCLSKCDALLYTVKSGPCYLAKKWRNGNSFEIDRLITASKKPNLDSWAQLISFFENHKVVAIYGTGKVAEKIIFYLRSFSKKIVFVDKRANNNQFVFNGFNVISPDKMKNQYFENKINGVFISSTAYAEEIEKELLDMSIQSLDIINIKDLDIL